MVLNYWLTNEHVAHYQQDIPLMAQMHVNTVRVYGDFGDDPSIYTSILDTFYANHIMVVMTVPSSKAGYRQRTLFDGDGVLPKTIPRAAYVGDWQRMELQFDVRLREHGGCGSRRQCHRRRR